MGKKSKKPRQVSLLTPQQQRVSDLFGSQIEQGLRSPEQFSVDIAGLSPEQQQLRSFLGGLQPFSEGSQGALESLLSGEPTFRAADVQDERLQLLSQQLAPQRRFLEDQLSQQGDIFGGLGLTRSGGFQVAQADAIRDFSETQAGFGADILQRDIDAEIASGESARQLQALGIQLEQGGIQQFINNLSGFGETTRGIEQAQLSGPLLEQFLNNPLNQSAAQFAGPFAAQQQFGFQNRSSGGSGIGSVLGGLGGAGLGFLFGGGIPGATFGQQLGSGAGGLF